MVLIERIQEALLESYEATGRKVSVTVELDEELWREAVAGTIGPIVRFSSAKIVHDAFTFQWHGGTATFKRKTDVEGLREHEADENGRCKFCFQPSATWFGGRSCLGKPAWLP